MEKVMLITRRFGSSQFVGRVGELGQPFSSVLRESFLHARLGCRRFQVHRWFEASSFSHWHFLLGFSEGGCSGRRPSEAEI